MLNPFFPRSFGFGRRTPTGQPLANDYYSFNGGIYRGWGHWGNDSGPTPATAYRDTIFLLRAPVSLHSEVFNAPEEDITFTLTNSYWGNVPIYTRTYEYWGGRYFETWDGYYTNNYTKYKTVLDAFGNPTSVYEELQVYFGSWLKDETASDYEYTLLAPCNENYIYVEFFEDLWGELIMGHSDAAYWNSRMAETMSWNIYFSIGSKTIFDGTLTTTPQDQVPYTNSPVWPFERLSYPLDDAYVCTYEGPRRPAVNWTWSGTGISIPDAVTWITGT